MAGSRTAYGAVAEKDTSEQIWPGPSSNVKDFVTGYADRVDNRMFHVDYLLNTFRDFARPNLYKIEFVYGSQFQSNYSFLSAEACLMTELTAKTVNIPAFDIGKTEVRRSGERFFLPSNQNFSDLQMILLCDDDYTQRKFLQSWMKHIVYDTDNNYYHKLRNMYDCKLIVRQFDSKFNTTFAAEFTGVWPFSIGEIQMSQDSDAQVVEFPATFCYSKYKILSGTTD